MNNNIERLLEEEIKNQVNSLNVRNVERVKKVIHELFNFSTENLLTNMGSQDAILDEKDSIGEENWDWLISMINQSYNESPEDWKKDLKKQKLIILCYKYFTKQNLIDLDEVEKSLKFEIKKYFTALQNYSDMGDFREKFFNLPSEMSMNFTRYILNNSKKLNKEIGIDKEEVKKKIKDLAEDRKKMIENLSLISQKYQSVLNLEKLKELFNNGLFFEDNLLNRGVNEYVSKLLNNKETSIKIKNIFNSVIVSDLLKQAESSSAYIKHIDSIKTEQSREYFTSQGFQIGKRFDNEIEISKNAKSQKGLVIDKDSRFKEPTSVIKSVSFPWEEDNTNLPVDASTTSSSSGSSSSPSSGSDFGGGGFSGGSEFTGGEQGGIGVDDSELADGSEDTGENGGTETTTGTEGETPIDGDGFPVDFGTPEDNGTSDNDNDNDDAEKEKEPAQ